LRYLPKSESERRQMLDACGVEEPEDLFGHLPEAVRLKQPLRLPPGPTRSALFGARPGLPATPAVAIACGLVFAIAFAQLWRPQIFIYFNF